MSRPGDQQPDVVSRMVHLEALAEAVVAANEAQQHQPCTEPRLQGTQSLKGESEYAVICWNAIDMHIKCISASRHTSHWIPAKAMFRFCTPRLPKLSSGLHGLQPIGPSWKKHCMVGLEFFL